MNSMINLYYTPPSDAAFEDMRKAAAEVWKKYKDEPGDYYEEKMSVVRRVQNISDNFMYLFAMFDFKNQRECVALLEPSTIEEVRVRLIAGGNPYYMVEQILGII